MSKNLINTAWVDDWKKFEKFGPHRSPTSDSEGGSLEGCGGLSVSDHQHVTERLDVQSFDAVHHGAVVIDRKITQSIHRQVLHCGKGTCKIEDRWSIDILQKNLMFHTNSRDF